MKKKDTVITFKVDDDLLKVLEKIPNRSAFIRTAIVSALENVCPLCNGTGAEDHMMCTCRECHEKFLVCSRSQ